ncbi:hypothetical protein [Lentibacillus sp.]|uniref:hypothetical protein n=1 Tax=Lentibacillus sp. TaxID=1925746 RepID=UPI002B4B3620|nr:hypothetical protein [Lentibacillus sp.]HLS10305.1 hypothetical protein [Lentibacillus sp.]
MRKWIVAITGVGLITLFVSFYWLNVRADAELANNKTMEIQEGDFILHIRAERSDGGFQVFRAIQYVGDESVEIEHQTPLISVSLSHPNHDYTGNTVSRTLETGNSYHPQDSIQFESPRAGTYTLFCKAEFMADDEQTNITLQEELTFQ